MRLLVLGFVLACSFDSSASAQSFDPGDIGIFADPSATSGSVAVTHNVPYNLYVIAFDPPGDMTGFEVDISGIPQGTTFLLSQTVVSGVDIDDDPNRLLVEFDECVGGDVVVLATLQFLSVIPPAADTAVCFGGAARPGYSDCAGNERDFGVAVSGQGSYPDGCLILNRTGCCPNPLKDFAMADVVASSDMVVLPLTFDSIPLFCRSPGCFTSRTYGFGGELVFDSTRAELISVSLGGQAPPWDIFTEELEPGRIDVRAIDPGHSDESQSSTPLEDLDGAPLLNFTFRMLGPGTEIVSFENAGVCEFYFSSILCSPTSGFDDDLRLQGSITQDPVASDARTFSTLKTRYRER